MLSKSGLKNSHRIITSQGDDRILKKKERGIRLYITVDYNRRPCYDQ